MATSSSSSPSPAEAQSQPTSPAEQGKKVRFDHYNIVARNETSEEEVDALFLIPCEDGAVAEVKIKMDSPTKQTAEKKATYRMEVSTTCKVTVPDRTVGEFGGRRQRSDGLYWEIPANFPGASVALLDHEPNVKQFLMGEFKENGYFVDVGANFGGYSVRAAAWDMKVYSFEPNPESVKLLERNAELNHVSINVFPYALGSEVKKVRLSPNGGFARVLPGGDEGLEVEVRTLDSFDLPGADILKVDVEGYELEVIKGARNTIEKYHPMIMIEMHYWAGAESEFAMFQILKERGYKLKYLDKYGLGMHLLAFPPGRNAR